MPSGERVEVPDVSYARSGDVSIAYQVVGEGPTDLVLFPFLSNLYTLWQAPRFAEFGYRLDWFVWHHRLTTSPMAWAEFRRMQVDLDVRDALPAIRVPTLVVAKERERSNSEQVASRIPGAEYVTVPGIGRAIQENEFAVEAIETFLEGSPARRIPDTVLATVLFTDLVNSTQRAAELGDRDWRSLLERHHELVRMELARYGSEIEFQDRGARELKGVPGEWRLYAVDST